ncbi:GGDEF domain-containing protein [Oceanicoccus sp. KOV_DT_Chl]|uniref:GGDEF domain-containing protein n=1 Tax=Oceanicoccus sp. KOV_DT_Chl TaxID=1904639 RepID=UPI000C7C8FAA|nr:diguanylate cyclase [Oceanicoccus sp. KOV_DT_Chl]
MREQFSAIQQSVEAATELDQLKSAVSTRLEQVVALMDKHQSGEVLREQSLSEQLDALVARVKNMEADSAQAEERIEEQRQKALRDVLTQLPNREAYNQRLEQECERWQRYDRPLTMAVCDVDHFKRVNDTYGHLAGDKVLRIIAKTLRKRLRKTDFIARFGGEEFVVLMPETEQASALKVVEGVREAIASCPFHFKEKPVTITMSFGVSTFSGEDNGEAVFARCDKALYQAKEQGRNQSVVAGQPVIEL